MKTFADRVRKIVKQIPQGSVLSYKQVAEAAGSPRAFRAVGTIMKYNHDPSIPCHRVIRSDGKMGEYNGGREIKRKLLHSEGWRNKKSRRKFLASQLLRFQIRFRERERNVLQDS